MKIYLLSFLLILSISFTASSQVVLNGTIDSFDELTSVSTYDVVMDDGTVLKMEMFFPIMQDSVVQIVNIPGIGNVPIEIIPRYTQYIVYDSINHQAAINKYQLPLVFSRTPYNMIDDPLGPVFAFLGYAYGAQDMRGANQSAGVYFPMYSDGWNKNPYHPHIRPPHDITAASDPRNSNNHEDGYQTLQRILYDLNRVYDINGDNQPDTFLITNGSIGMIGASALGNSQYSLAASHPIDASQPGLQSIMPLVASADHYLYTLTNNGVFRDALVFNWVTSQIIHLTNDAYNSTDTSIMNAIHSSADYGMTNKLDVAKLSIDYLMSMGARPGYYPNSPIRSTMDASFAPVDALGNPDSNGAYSRFRNMDVPAFHLTGWWDIFVDGQIFSFNSMRDELSNPESKNLQKLIIGPWAHQTIGNNTTGDMTYPNNVMDVLQFDPYNMSIALNNGSLEHVLNSEFFTWFRYTLNQKGVPYTSDPKFIIPESQNWQDIGSGMSIRIPSTDYIIPYVEFLQFLSGHTGLNNISFEMQSVGGTNTYTYNIPPLSSPIIPMNDTITELPVPNFSQVPPVRAYIAGPVNDGVTENANVGNYWYACDSFPISNGITMTPFYLHADSSISLQAPVSDEGSLGYIHDPDNPVLTVGGANMTVKTPQGTRHSQGQMNLADPLFIDYTMNHPGVLQFSSGFIQDSLRIFGFPTATIYARTDAGSSNGPTDTDFFIRILDVYPDGRELFVVEGCVNARAREYVRTIYNGIENPDTPFSNITTGVVYEYQLKMMPIGYVWGKNHKIKVLISSGNYPRYQSNPNLPINPNEFFRRKPNDGQSYTFSGTTMNPRIAVQTLRFSDVYPSHISLPVFGTVNNAIESHSVISTFDLRIYPNPVSDYFFVQLPDEKGNLFVHSIDGKLIDRIHTSGSVRLNASVYKAGTYIIRYASDANSGSCRMLVIP